MFFLISALSLSLSALFSSPVQVPGPAPNLQVVSNTPTSVSLSWDKPLTGNGEILTYKLYYTDKSVGNEQVGRNHTVKELTKCRQYDATLNL